MGKLNRSGGGGAGSVQVVVFLLGVALCVIVVDGKRSRTLRHPYFQTSGVGGEPDIITANEIGGYTQHGGGGVRGKEDGGGAFVVTGGYQVADEEGGIRGGRGGYFQGQVLPAVEYNNNPHYGYSANKNQEEDGGGFHQLHHQGGRQRGVFKQYSKFKPNIPHHSQPLHHDHPLSYHQKEMMQYQNNNGGGGGHWSPHAPRQHHTHVYQHQPQHHPHPHTDHHPHPHMPHHFIKHPHNGVSYHYNEGVVDDGGMGGGHRHLRMARPHHHSPMMYKRGHHHHPGFAGFRGYGNYAPAYKRGLIQDIPAATAPHRHPHHHPHGESVGIGYPYFR